MEIINKILEDKVLKTTFLVLVIIIVLIFVVFLVQYNIDRSRGVHAKFLWFESNIPSKQNENTEKKEPPIKIDDSKNVNTGTNLGNIGDTYEGIEQRHVTNGDAEILLNEIKNFRESYSGKINYSHITIGYPGDKESIILAQEVEILLRNNGYDKIEPMILQTYGVTGKKFGISNAPDNSIMVEIYPADNVK
ncbi:hypothetical protein [Sinomicrobium weinanense]|uniref:Uncharacterized protein n=1 Tax=Sinomicrobium weinanense TaxID=2842200 RepID=A0A926Q4K8_9FLAO|nr:hypothetical protein [Sinomicrobium weinanense]MBC9798084.1 hypothetical protein [Sinomicrobium weinanense]MBU3122554.1 hypothetical protein [Sinomicrobium weinanense]